MKNKISYQEFEKKLDLTDINFLLSSKEDGINWSSSKAKEMEKWYMRFLYLSYLYPKIMIVPTKEVDIYWHHHIMDTAKYYNDCKILFGKVFHHYPYLGTQGEQDKILLCQLFEQTNRLYEKHFNERPTKSSSNPTACGGVGGGSCGGKCGGRRVSIISE